MKPTVGFIGLGLIGKPMAQCVVRAEFPLVVWNRSAKRMEDLVGQGARAAGSPREAATQADVLLIVVSDPPAVEEVLYGANGALAAMRRGSILVDSSTDSPALARKIAASCAERGVDFLDAPVTGGTWGAEKGELVFMVGGKAEVLERAKPVLAAMGKRFFLLGPNGAGQAVKLSMNMILALQVQAFAEALALATGAGVPGEKLLEVMQSSMARAPVLDVKAPVILSGKFAPSFPLRLMHKDLTLALALAKEEGITLPAATAAHATYSAVKNAETEDVDFAAVAKFWKKN